MLGFEHRSIPCSKAALKYSSARYQICLNADEIGYLCSLVMLLYYP